MYVISYYTILWVSNDTPLNAYYFNFCTTEDYARSILQPGSSQDTSMPTTLALLNNVAIPHPIPDNEEQDREDVMYKLFQTLSAKVCWPSLLILNYKFQRI